MLEEYTLETHSWPGIPKGRLDDKMIGCQIRELLSYKPDVCGSRGHIAVCRRRDRVNTIKRLLEHRAITFERVKLLGMRLPAVWPESSPDTARSNHKLHKPGPRILQMWMSDRVGKKLTHGQLVNRQTGRFDAALSEHSARNTF